MLVRQTICEVGSFFLFLSRRQLLTDNLKALSSIPISIQKIQHKTENEGQNDEESMRMSGLIDLVMCKNFLKACLATLPDSLHSAESA